MVDLASPATCAGPLRPAEPDPHHPTMGTESPGRSGLIFPTIWPASSTAMPSLCGVPLLNASLTPAPVRLPGAGQSQVKSLAQRRVNAHGRLRRPANGPLQGILGYETQPLVSCDYVNDPRTERSSTVSSTLVTRQAQAQGLRWYVGTTSGPYQPARLADLAAMWPLVEGRWSQGVPIFPQPPAPSPFRPQSSLADRQYAVITAS